MADMHDVVVVGVPLIAILAGILFSRSDLKDLRGDLSGLRGEFNGLRGEMNDRFNQVDDHLGRIDADLRQFYHLTGNSKRAWTPSTSGANRGEPILKRRTECREIII